MCFEYRCDFAFKDVNLNVNKEVARVINEFVIGSKPIG